MNLLSNRRVVSARTWTVGIFGTLGTALVWALITLGIGGEEALTFWADVGEVALVWVAALVVLWTSLQFDGGEPLRRRWLLIAIGAILFVLGDLALAYYEVFLGVEVPVPGIADVLHMLVYPLVALSIMSAALAFRHLLDLRQPLAIAALVTLVLIVAEWFGLLRDVVMDSEAVLAERLLGAAYPVADLVFEFAPALFLVLVIVRLGYGRVGWPWWFVAAGFVLLAATDTAFAWLDWNEIYESGHVIDGGRMLGYAFVAIGASLSQDVHASRTT